MKGNYYLLGAKLSQTKYRDMTITQGANNSQSGANRACDTSMCNTFAEHRGVKNVFFGENFCGQTFVRQSSQPVHYLFRSLLCVCLSILSSGCDTFSDSNN